MQHTYFLIYINNTAHFTRKLRKSFEFRVISYTFAAELESAEHVMNVLCYYKLGAEKLPD